MAFETNQVRLKLKTDKAILQSLRRRKSLKKDEQGEKLILQFNGTEFTFRPGHTVTVGESVGRALLRSSHVIVGEDDLTGAYEPALEVIKSFRVDEVPEEEARSKTQCPVCGTETYSLARLAAHINDKHTDTPEEKAEKEIAEMEKEEKERGKAEAGER